MKRLSIVLLCIALLTACENKIDTEEQLSRPSSPSAQSFQRHSTEALEIARQLFNKTFDTRTATSSTGIQVIGVPTTSHLTRGTAVTSSLPDTLMYICNNGENNGFALISGDKRTPELLAYVPQGSYHQQDDINNSGFAVFISRLPGFIAQEIDNYNNDTTDSITPSSIHQTRSGFTEWETTLPLPISDIMTTKWGQSSPLNKYAPQLPNGQRALTGCVATAIGQLMVYHKHPQTLNGEKIDWRLLQDQNKIYTIDYTNQAARLLRTIGDLLENNWGESSTTADTNNSCKVLKQMGYQAPKELSAYNTDTLLMSLFFRRPVIVRGQDEKIFQDGKWEYKNGHAWIVDGYTRQTGTKTTFRRGRRRVEHLERVLFHCNWGWYGQYNGYFESGVFDCKMPVISDNSEEDKKIHSGRRGGEHAFYFQYNLQCIPNIRPLRNR